MSTDLEDGRDLRAVMERSLDGMRPEVAALAARSVACGRTLRRRRRAAGALLGLASAAAAAALVAPLVSGSDRAVEAPPADGVDDHPEQRTGLAQASFPNSLGVVRMPAREMLHRLESVLPPDAQITRADLRNTDVAPGETTARFGNLVVALDRPGADRRGEVEVVLYAAPAQAGPDDEAAAAEALTCPVAGSDAEPGRCLVLTSPSGTPVGRAWSSTYGDFEIREVLVRSTSGRWTYVADANSLDEKWGPGYDALDGHPPLTLTELRTIAESDVWVR